MVKYISMLTVALGVLFKTQAAVLTLSGVYQGKNPVVQNPPVSATEFCTQEVYVNETLVMSHLHATMYEIDLTHLKMDEPVTIKIVHKDDCTPKIMNPQVLRVNSLFQFTAFLIDERKMTWATKGEHPGGKMFVEQFVNNQWVVVKEIVGHGSITLNNYSAEESHFSGVNKYRIKFLGKDGIVSYSQPKEYTSNKQPVQFAPKRVITVVNLSRSVPWEVMDSFGNMIRKGNGHTIDMHDLKEGVYYLNFDNRTEKVLKK